MPPLAWPRGHGRSTYTRAMPRDANGWMRLAASGVGGQVTRILVEPVAVSAAGAVALIDDIHRALDRLGLTAPRLQHGDGEATWVLLTDAIRRGLDTRIGLEDTLYEPNGERTAGNAALVRAARGLGAGIA